MVLGWVQPEYSAADFMAKIDLGLLVQASADKTLNWTEKNNLDGSVVREYNGSGYTGVYHRRQKGDTTYINFVLIGAGHWKRKEIWRGDFCVEIISEQKSYPEFYRRERYNDGRLHGASMWSWGDLERYENYFDGQLHAVNEAATYFRSKNKLRNFVIFCQFGQRHRLDDKPAVWRGGMKKYYRFGQLHRIGGPAIDYRKSANNIHIQYWRNGQLVPGPNGTAVAYRKGQRACVVSQTNGVWRVRFSIGPRHHVISAPTAVLHYKAAANPAAHRASKYVTAGPHPAADYPVATIGGVSSYYVGTTLLYDGHVRLALFDLLPVCIAREIDAILATVARITV